MTIKNPFLIVHRSPKKAKFLNIQSLIKIYTIILLQATCSFILKQDSNVSATYYRKTFHPLWGRRNTSKIGLKIRGSLAKECMVENKMEASNIKPPEDPSSCYYTSSRHIIKRQESKEAKEAFFAPPLLMPHTPLPVVTSRRSY